MQLMPQTAAWCNVDPLVTRDARRCAARLLRLHLRRSGGDVRWALAAYVGGARQAERQPWAGAIERYVRAVLERVEGR